MRRLLTGGIKAILAIAMLSTVAHWALRVQRDHESSAQALASLAEPVTTGSIAPRRAEQAAPAPTASASLDQDHLSALIASTTGAKPKVQKTVAQR